MPRKAANKGLAEYAPVPSEPVQEIEKDTDSEVSLQDIDFDHVDKSLENTPQEQEAPKKKLTIVDGPGNLKKIQWTGGGRIPKECEGMWNDVKKAQDAIRTSYARLQNESTAS